MVHPTRGDRRPVFDYEDVRKAEEGQERAERLRLYYVAMTRAIDRLIVSGAIDTDRKSDRETPIGWVLERLAAAETVTEAGRQADRARARRGAVPAAGRAVRGSCRAGGGGGSGRAAGALRGDPPGDQGPGLELPEIVAPAEPPVRDVRRLSYSALALFERCSYRYSPSASCGSRRSAGEWAATGRPTRRDGDRRCSPPAAELVPLDEPRPPGRPGARRRGPRLVPAVSAEELDRIASSWTRTASPRSRVVWVASRRPSGAAVLLRARRRPAPRPPRRALAQARRALVADYKSNVLDGADPSEVVDAEYRVQRLVYALACLRDGADEVEVVYQFLERPDDLVSATFTREEVGALEGEYRPRSRIREGDFRPTPSEFACSGCPALDLVCAGPRLVVHQD